MFRDGRIFRGKFRIAEPAGHLPSRPGGRALAASYAGGAAGFALLYGVPVWGFAMMWLALAAAITIRTARGAATGWLFRPALTEIWTIDTYYQSDIILIGVRVAGTTLRRGIPMNASNDNTAAKGLRGWWASPPRPGMQRLINPWEYRHLRAFGVTRIAGGSVAAGAGLICLSYGVHGWAAFFLVLGAANLAGGCWYLTIDRSAPARA